MAAVATEPFNRAAWIGPQLASGRTADPQTLTVTTVSAKGETRKVTVRFPSTGLADVAADRPMPSTHAPAVALETARPCAAMSAESHTCTLSSLSTAAATPAAKSASSRIAAAGGILQGLDASGWGDAL